MLIIILSWALHAAEQTCRLGKANAFEQAKQIQAMNARLLYRFVCPPGDLTMKSEGKGIRAPSAELKAKMEGAVFPIYITNGASKLEDLKLMSMGSGFAVRTAGGERALLSAGHVTQALDQPGSRLILGRPGDGIIVRNDDGVSARLQGPLLLEEARMTRELEHRKDSELPFVDNDFGLDIAQIATKEAVDVRPIEARDLEREPLSLDEPLYLAGTQLGGYKILNCANRGIDKGTFSNRANVNVFAVCEGIKPSSAGPPLGGVSGGAIVDASGKAVAAFNGWSMATDMSRVFIRGVPLFKSEKAGGIAFTGYPVVGAGEVRCMPCYDHFDGAADKFLERAKELEDVCVFARGKKPSRLERLNDD